MSKNKKLKILRAYQLKDRILDRLFAINNVPRNCVQCSCELEKNAYVIRGEAFNPLCSFECAEIRWEKIRDE